MARDYGSLGAGTPAVGFADFSPTELYTLIEHVASNIIAVNSGWRSLEKTTRLLGTPRDTAKLRDKARETQQSVNASVAATTRDLRRLSVVVRRGDKRQKLQVEKLGQSFTDSLAKYSLIQKQYSEKMQMHLPKMPMSDFPTEGGGGEEDDDNARLIAQKQAQARVLEFESGMLEEREAYIRQIEADVIDVDQIMKELSSMVITQGATIDTIESNIEAGGSRIEAGNEELAKAARYQSKFRRKIFILIAIALIVGIILAIIIVSSLKR